MASLRDELRAIPGVAEAEVEGDAASPSSLRIRLAPGADGERVGAEVQRLLAARGMRSSVGAGSAPGPQARPLVAAAPQPAPAPAEPGERPPVLGWVRVQESGAALTVTVAAADGREVTRAAPASEEGLSSAVIEAVGVLLTGVPPRVVAVQWSHAEGARLVTVVLETPGGATGAGAGLVRASRAYAVARASWSALSP